MDTSLAQKLSNYEPSESTKQLIKDTKILFLVGPTGAGKDAIKDKLLQTGRFHHIVSHTTRAPRINNGIAEQDGQDYHFIDKAMAKKMLDDQAFVEAKIYSENLYGTSVAEIQAAYDEGKVAMTDLEVQGVAEYKALDPNVTAIFVLPPDFQTWQKRLRQRYGDSMNLSDYRLRLQTAEKELEELLRTNYYIAIINDSLDKVIKSIQAIIDSDNHNLPDKSTARLVAKQLTRDIETYLSSNL